MPKFDDEINFTEYVLLLWQRKWLIIISTVIVVIIASIYFLFSPKIWKTEMIIEPSKFLAETAGGGFNKVTTINPRQLAGQIKEASYDQLLARQLNIELGKFPRLRAEHLTNTDLVRVYVRIQDTERAKLALTSLFNHVKFIYDKKVDTELQGINTEISDKNNSIKSQELGFREKENQIKTLKSKVVRTKNEISLKESEIQSNEINKDRMKKEIESHKNRLKISEERINSISEEMNAVKERINDTEEQLKRVLAENKEENTAISLLLYSNEIQQNLRYFSVLSEKISNERLAQENLYLLILNNEKEIRQIDNNINQIKILKNTISTQIDDINTQIDMIEIDKEKIAGSIDAMNSQKTFLEEKKARFDYTQLIKEPTVLGSPVSISVKKGALIAAIASLLIFSLIAIFLENLKKIKSKN
jgi:hypothetical protein